MQIYLRYYQTKLLTINYYTKHSGMDSDDEYAYICYVICAAICFITMAVLLYITVKVVKKVGSADVIIPMMLCMLQLSAICKSIIVPFDLTFFVSIG